MTDKKEQILTQLRSRYESKYGSSDALKQVITSELSKISKKKKINIEDLSELESRISCASKTASLLTTSHEGSLQNNFLSPKIRKKINQLGQIRSLANSPLREHQNSTNDYSDDKSPTSISKPRANESYSNINLPPISPTYLTPMELKILKSQGLKNSKFLLDSSIEENNESSVALSKSTNLSPIRKDQSPAFRLPPGQKGQEREKAINENIWRKINEHNLKKAEEEEMNKAEKLRNKKKEWMESLQKQISDKKDKASMLKNKDIIWSQKSVEIDLQRKIDEQEKEKEHKRKMRSLERENFAQIFKEKEEQKKKLAEQKEKEAFEASYEVHEYSEKKKVFEENNKRKKKHLNEILEEDMNIKVSQTKEKMTKDKEEDAQINLNIIEKIKQDEGKSEDFLRALKDRARRMPDAELAKKKGYDNLRQYGQIGANEDNNQGLMKFLYADRHNDHARTQKKMVNQSALQQSYEQQRNNRVEKAKEYKNYVGEQRELWKKEEEDMNAREELTIKVTKLKRQAQKEELDAQREIDAPLKAQIVSQNEAWVNKSTLKELQVIPEKTTERRPYLKGF